MATAALNETPRWLAEYEPALANLAGVLPPIQRLLVSQARLIYLRLLDDLSMSALSNGDWPTWESLPARFIRAQLETPTAFGIVLWEQDWWGWQETRN